MEDICVNNKITIPVSAVTVKFSRSGGKGGQNVNKVSTRVELVLDVDGIVCDGKTKSRIKRKLANKLDRTNALRIVSQESRSQWQNKQSAIDKLVEMVSDAAVEEKERFATKPTRSSKIRRVEEKKKSGQRKQLRKKSVTHDDD
jgi:ribosome-associated protein